MRTRDKKLVKKWQKWSEENQTKMIEKLARLMTKHHKNSRAFKRYAQLYDALLDS